MNGGGLSHGLRLRDQARIIRTGARGLPLRCWSKGLGQRPGGAGERCLDHRAVQYLRSRRSPLDVRALSSHAPGWLPFAYSHPPYVLIMDSRLVFRPEWRNWIVWTFAVPRTLCGPRGTPGNSNPWSRIWRCLGWSMGVFAVPGRRT